MLFEVTDLHAHYGKSHVLAGMTLSVREGEVVSVLGRNGSGRSTALKAMIGLVPPSSGSVRLRGVELAGRPPHEIVRAGVSYVPEERLVFSNLTVEENLETGIQRASGGQDAWTVDAMYDYFPRLRERRSTKAGNLSGGEQQMLTLCRSLLGHPKVLLVDEPTEGLAPMIVRNLVDVLMDVNRRGVAILLVEQRMTIALRVSTRSYVIGRGRVVFEGLPQEIRENRELRRNWLEAA